ncbi:TRAP transporter large permease subunit [Clostridiaceae bacterium 35-E11]
MMSASKTASLMSMVASSTLLTIVALDVILLVVLLMFSIPLPYCFGGALVFMAIFGGASMKSMMLWGFNQMISPVLVASPLFILAGMIMGSSGIAKHLLNFADIIVGKIKGGISVVAVITCERRTTETNRK